MRKRTVGRIIASVKIENITDPAKSLRCDALVDTGASHLVLPNAWKERLAGLQGFDSLRPDPRFQDLMRRVGLL